MFSIIDFMLNFAHSDVVHANEVESAVHNWPAVLGLTLIVLALVGFVYWLLVYKSKPQEKEDKE